MATDDNQPIISHVDAFQRAVNGSAGFLSASLQDKRNHLAMLADYRQSVLAHAEQEHKLRIEWLNEFFDHFMAMLRTEADYLEKHMAFLGFPLPPTDEPPHGESEPEPTVSVNSVFSTAVYYPTDPEQSDVETADLPYIPTDNKEPRL